ncbi:MAG: hypothetical protein ABI082_07505 [Dokdonella sp.]
MKIYFLLVSALAIYSVGASAAVKQSGADSFLLTYSAPITTPPAKAYASIAQVQQWWSDDYTWSGKAANLTLAPTAGGCFCERWKDGSVEHGRVILAVQDRLLRIDGALGPLQELATKGVLDFMINTGGDGATQLSVEYRVTGASDSALDTLAPQVDQHLGAQVARLVRYINTGNPEQPLVATPTQQASDVRAALLHAWATQAADEKSAAPKKADIPPKPAKKP